MDENLVNIRFFNGSNGVELMDILVNDRPLATGLAYGEYTRVFRAAPGIYNIQLRPQGLYSEISYAENVDFASGVYTFATCGDLNHVEFIIIGKEPGDELPRVRFANLSPFDSVLDVVLDEADMAPGLMYREVSPSFGIDDGDYHMEIFDTHTDDLIFDKQITIEPLMPHLGMILGKIGSMDWPIKFIMIPDM
ncbi:MAG: DUF4397 domain-containing protein [Defluviitaleaceae bacterium]|nr:DUF4397 domain-containing protein [Defluviitaleaceae bacterium]